MKATSKPSLDNKVDKILSTLTKLSGEFENQKEKLNEVQDSVLWLVDEYKKIDEDKVVSNYQIREALDAVERLDTRTNRIEDNLKLPKLKFSF